MKDDSFENNNNEGQSLIFSKNFEDIVAEEGPSLEKLNHYIVSTQPVNRHGENYKVCCEAIT